MSLKLKICCRQDAGEMVHNLRTGYALTKKLLQAGILETHPVSYLAVTTKTMQSTHDFMHIKRTRRACWLRFVGLGGIALGFGLGSSWAQASSAPIRVAAASDLKFALAQLSATFERDTGQPIAITYGSSGTLARQIEQGLPMDLFLSADESLVLRLAQSGWAQDAGVVYATGQLAWVVSASAKTALDPDLKGLLSSLHGGKLAIANPEHAPYGRAARAALQSAQLWDRVQGQLVLGENVSQATQFVSSGAAQAGLVALSLAQASELSSQLRYVRVNDRLHPPIIQRMALRRGAKPAAMQFYMYLQSAAAKKLFAAHGLGSSAQK
jgi:molybdate transport system substrate-binding protein